MIAELEGPRRGARGAGGARGARARRRRRAAFLTAVAHQTALALERARLYEETRDIAHTLQRSMLAGEAPEDPRFTIAALYQPAVEYLEIGGDWHDAFSLPGGKIGIVVGDVVGRGLPAASAMGQLRSAVRALAGAGLGPEAVTRHLDTFVEQLPASQYATLAYAEVDPATGDVTFSAAGHLPPVLFGRDARASSSAAARPRSASPHPRSRAPRTRSRSPRAPGSSSIPTASSSAAGSRSTRAWTPGRDLVHPHAHPQELVSALLEDGTSDDDVCVLIFRRT